MADLLPKLRVVTWVIHGLVAIALAWLLSKTGAMAGWCVFPGLLIACASVAANPGRPVPLYAAFGTLMGFTFWQGVSIIHAGQYLGLIPCLLLLAGVSWFLREPAWPSFLFTGVVIGLFLALLARLYDKRFELDIDSVDAVRIVNTSMVVLTVGAVYLALGFAEVMLGRARRKKKKSRAIRTPVDPPVL